MMVTRKSGAWPAMGIYVVTLLLTIGCATTEQDLMDSLDEPLATYTNKVIVNGHQDSLSTSIEINTREVWKEKRGLVGLVWDDAFLRGYVSKTTGAVSYQVYTIQYAEDWLFPQSATYSRPPREVETSRVSSDVDCSTDSCRHVEHAVFSIDQQEIDRVLSGAKRELFATTVWRFRVSNQQGPNWDYFLPLQEILAFAQITKQISSHVRTVDCSTACNLPSSLFDIGSQPDFWPEFISGKIQLAQSGFVTGYGTALKAGVSVPKLEKHLAAKQWKPIVEIVVNNNYAGDVQWFLLGLAARGLGYPQAAQHYFEQSIKESKRKLRGSCIGSVCMGFNFPEAAEAALGREATGEEDAF